MDYRIVFSKTGSVRYISHLDLNRCMIRAVRRSGLPAWYTEGFHPHMYLMFPLALSLGTESLCEVMDIRLTCEMQPEEILRCLNAALPEGLHAKYVGMPVHTAVEIGSADYRIELQTEDAQALLEKWHGFLSRSEIPVEKRTKRGKKEVDIRPMIQLISAAAEPGKLTIFLRLPAGNEGNLNANIVMESFQSYAEQPFYAAHTVREKIFCQNGEEFF